jgi:hypothetical protein
MINIPPRKMSAMTAIAYHEAGHAIVSQRLGVLVKRVSIIPEEDTAGSCTHNNILRGTQLDVDDSDRGRVRAEKTIMICLAGPIAQRLWRARSVRKYHAGADYARAADLAIRCNGSAKQVDAHLKWLEIRTEDMLKLLWPAVQALVADLLQNGTMTYTSISPVAVHVRPPPQ